VKSAGWHQEDILLQDSALKQPKEYQGHTHAVTYRCQQIRTILQAIVTESREVGTGKHERVSGQGCE